MKLPYSAHASCLNMIQPHAIIGVLRLAWRAAGALACAVFVQGCGDCLLIGCPSGLELDFNTPPVAPYRVELFSTTPNESPVFVYDCPDITRCSKAPRFENYYPARTFVRITYQGKTATNELQPQYTESEINGTGCGTCRRGTAKVVLP